MDIVPSEKQCIRCNETKPVEFFYKSKNSADGRVGHCAKCASEAKKKRYPALRDAHNAHQRERYATDLNYRQKQLDEKHRYYRRNRTEVRRKAKENRDANVEEWKRVNRQRTHNRRELLWRIKRETGCKVCGERHPACLDFHHRNKAEKAFSVAEASGGSFSLEEVYAEIAKCDCICANCHRRLHWNEKWGPGSIQQTSLDLDSLEDSA